MVLLAAYEGIRFLDAQMRSILDQAGVAVSILCRDDGSTDGTRERLTALAVEDARITLIDGPHLGAAGSFLELFRHLPPDEYDMVALADQDDLWVPDRLLRQYQQLAKLPPDAMAVCYCGFLPINAAGQTISPPKPAARLPHLDRLLFFNDVPGCTMALTPAAARLIARTAPDPARIVMHDWWIMLVILCAGQVVRLDEPLVLYRQYGGNLIGLPRGVRHRFRRIARLLAERGDATLRVQIQTLHCIAASLADPAPRHRIVAVLSGLEGALMQRWQAVSDKKGACFASGRLLRLLILLGHFRRNDTT